MENRIPASKVGLTGPLPGAILFGLGALRKNGPFPVLSLSEGGICLQAAKKLPPGTRYRLRLEVPRLEKVLEMSCEVRWSHSVPGNQQFRSGLRFTESDEPRSRTFARMREWFASPEHRRLRARRESG